MKGYFGGGTLGAVFDKLVPSIEWGLDLMIQYNSPDSGGAFSAPQDLSHKLFKESENPGANLKFHDRSTFMIKGQIKKRCFPSYAAYLMIANEAGNAIDKKIFEHKIDKGPVMMESLGALQLCFNDAPSNLPEFTW